MAGETLPPVIGELQLTIDDLVAKLDEAKQKLRDFASQRADASVGADTGDADAKIDDVRSKMSSLDDEHAEPTVSANASEADEAIDDTRARLDAIDGKDANATITADNSEADAKIDETKAKADALNRPHNVNVAANTSGADSSITSFAMKLAMLGPMAGAASVAVAGAFAALPGILAGATAGIGSLAIGFHNVTAAISAYTNASQQAGITGLQMAQQQISNAQTLTNAANQVASAQLAMAQTEVSAYDQVHQAQEQIIQSEQQLEQAEYAERMAQMQLTDARMQAQFALENYKNQLKDMALSVSQAQLAIQNARLSLNETMADPLATQLQRQQAKLSYQQAVQQLTDLKTQQQQLQAQAALAAQRGVSGSEAVRSATQGVVSAQQQLGNAQRSRADAFMYLSQAEVQRTQDLAAAQRQLTLAVQNQAYAEREVAIAIKMPIGATAQLVQAMNKLGPAGQAFVNWWHTNMTPLLHQLTLSDQAVLLPGLQKVLEVLKPYIEALKPILDRSAAGFVHFAMSVARFLTSAQGLKELRSTMASGFAFMQDFGKVILDVMKAFGSLGSRAGPIIRELGTGMAHMAADFAKWASGGGLGNLIHLFEQMAPLIGRVLHSLGPLLIMAGLAAMKFDPLVGVVMALLPVFEAIAPLIMRLVVPLAQVVHSLTMHLDASLEKLLTRLLTAISPLIPPLIKIVGIVGNGLITAFTNLAMTLTPFVSVIASALTPVLDALVPVVRMLAPLFTPILFILDAMTDPILAVAYAVGFLMQHWRIAWTVIKDVGLAVWHLIDAAIHNSIIRTILDIVSPLFLVATHWRTVWGIIRDVGLTVWHFLDNDVFHPLMDFFSSAIMPVLHFFANLWRTTWDGIKTVVEDVWHFLQPIFHVMSTVLGGIGHGLSGLVHGVSGLMHGASSVGHAVLHDINPLNWFAEGGIVTQPSIVGVGEAGPEAIIPLDRVPSGTDVGGVNVRALAHMFGGGMAGGAPMTGAGDQYNIYSYAQTNATAHDIAREIGWEMRTHPKGG